MSVLSSRRHQWTQTVTRSGGVGAAVDGGEVGGGRREMIVQGYKQFFLSTCVACHTRDLLRALPVLSL